MKKIVIIGSGPAGVSASLYTKRAGIDTVVISNSQSSLDKAEMIENYYGFSNPISPIELQKNGIDGAKRLGVEFIDNEVVNIEYDGSFSVDTKDEKIKCDSVIIAVGSKRNTLNIQGVKEFEGKGISYCAVCDAFFYRNKNVAVVGDGDFAVSEAIALENVAGSVKIFTNGKTLNSTIENNFEVVESKIKSFEGNGKLESVMFENGEDIAIDGVFMALGSAGAFALGKKLGCFIENNKMVVNENMETNVPGLFAAGDCVGGLLQISKAVADGAVAGLSAVKFVKKIKEV